MNGKSRRTAASDGPSTEWTAGRVAAAAQMACLFEAHAPKPGNVSPGHDFADVRYEDFVASAAAIGQSFTDAGTASIGAVVRAAIEATAAWTSSNTNLGLVLLCAPIAKAAIDGPADLREAIGRVLDATTVEDARDVYAAIRLASPGGLGRADQQDVAREPTLPLREIMVLATDRDNVAREYATAFATTFETSVPALRQARTDGLGWDDAIVETYLTLLAALPDTHIVRRAGADRAASVSRLAGEVLVAGGVRTDRGRVAIARFDRSLRDAQNTANPGTTADLTAAAIFVALLTGSWDSAA